MSLKPDLKHMDRASSFGPLTIVWRETAEGPIVERVFLPRESTMGELRSDFPESRRGSHPLITELADAMAGFLDGSDATFSLATIALDTCSPFQRRVLRAEHRIPRGWVSTYGGIAAHLDVPGGGRAVGRALATNPFPIIIPCHRAIRSDGRLGGYQGGVPMKRILLEYEGVEIEDDGRIRRPKLFYPPAAKVADIRLPDAGKGCVELQSEEIMAGPRQLTLIASIDDILRSKRGSGPGYTIRTMTAGDKPALARIYFAAYGRKIVSNLEAAKDEIDEAFDGEFGQLDLEASPIVTSMDAPVGSVMTVTEAPWDDTPPGPFIIEVMIHPDHRARGLAEQLMAFAARRLAARGKRTVALRVMSDNEKALALYRKLGFITWDPSDSSRQQTPR